MFRRPSRIIVPEFRAPSSLSLIGAAELLGESRRAIAAQLVDLAVRRRITIARGKTRRSAFLLTLATPVREVAESGAHDEAAVLRVLFGESAGPGATRTLRRHQNRQLGAALREPHRRSVAQLIADGLVRERTWIERIILFWRKQPTEPTRQAEPLVDHLWGVRDYIAFAEKDRLRFLQSPDGAERRPGPDGFELLRVHELLLPYAILFGLEHEWMRQLDVQYQELAQGSDLVDALVLNDYGLIDGVFDIASSFDGANLDAGVADIADVASVDVPSIDAAAVDIPSLDVGAAVDLGDVADGLGSFLGGLGDLLGGL